MKLPYENGGSKMTGAQLYVRNATHMLSASAMPVVLEWKGKDIDFYDSTPEEEGT